MLELVLINEVHIWVNALKIVHVVERRHDGFADVQMDDGTVYNTTSKVEPLTTRVHKALRAIHSPHA